MHNDGHSCFPRGSVENYADGKFLFLTIARLYRFIIMMLFPVQLDGEERIFRSLVKNDKIKPSRIEQIMVRNIFPENLRERDLFMHNALSVPYSNNIERMVQTGQEGILRFRAVRFYAQSAGRNIVCTCANTKLLDRGLN